MAPSGASFQAMRQHLEEQWLEDAQDAAAPRQLIQPHLQAAKFISREERAIRRQRVWRDGGRLQIDHVAHGHDVGAFGADMPPVRTRREMLVEQARDYDRRMASKEAAQQQRESPLRER